MRLRFPFPVGWGSRRLRLRKFFNSGNKDIKAVIPGFRSATARKYIFKKETIVLAQRGLKGWNFLRVYDRGIADRGLPSLLDRCVISRKGRSHIVKWILIWIISSNFRFWNNGVRVLTENYSRCNFIIKNDTALFLRHRLFMVRRSARRGNKYSRLLLSVQRKTVPCNRSVCSRSLSLSLFLSCTECLI